MYAREPLLVACPRDAAEVAAAIAVAGRFDVPVVSRGGGTSLAGQTVGGRGIVLDTSRYMSAIGEIDTEARRVRVGPGVVQEDLNRAAQKLGFGFGPDTSTSNRATIGGMIGNNSSGSHSIVYGTTIDHVHELEVVLADGSQATLGAGDRPAHQDGLREILRDHADAIANAYPKHWRQAGGYRLDYLAREFNLAKLVTGSEGTLVAITEAEVGLVPLPKARMFAVGHFESVARRDRGHRGRAGAGAGGGGDDRQHDPRAVALQARVPRAVGDDRGRSRRAAVRDGLRRHAGRGARPARPPRVGRLPHDRGRDGGRAGGADQGPQGRARAADGGQRGRAPAARLRRGHRGGARAARRLRRDLQGDPRPPRAGRPAGTGTARSAACTSARSSTSPSRAGSRRCARSPRRSSTWWCASTGSTRPSTATAARAASSTAASSATTSTRRFRKVKALFDPHGRLNPGVMVDAAPITEDLRDPALPPRGRAGDAARVPRRDARRRRPLPADRRLPQDRHRRHVPVLHGHARGGARHARARQRAGQGPVVAGSARRDGGRAAARDPRPLPRVQGVQERVPAERRHGLAEGRVPQPLPGRARRAAALAPVRLDPRPEPARLGDRAGLEPRAARPAASAWRGSTAGGRCRASRATR